MAAHLVAAYYTQQNLTGARSHVPHMHMLLTGDFSHEPVNCSKRKGSNILESFKDMMLKYDRRRA